MDKLQRKDTKDKLREKISAKPVLGKPIGTFKFTLKYADGAALELCGFASDVSGLCLGEKAQRDFKRMIFEQAKAMGCSLPVDSSVSASDSQAIVPASVDNIISEKAAIEVALKELYGVNFLDVCKVILVEEFSNHQQHFLIQVGQLDWLTEYAYNIDSAQWSYLKGLQYEYLLAGKASSLPFPKSIWGLGKVFIHVFIPENDKEDMEAAAEYLGKIQNLAPIVPMIRAMGDVAEVLKAKEDEIDAKDDAIKRLRQDYSEKSTLNEAAKTAIAGLEGEDDELPTSPNRGFGPASYLAVVGLGLLFGWFGSTLAPLGWLAFPVGNIFGFFVLSWRKRL
jgi:hypothetical protein